MDIVFSRRTALTLALASVLAGLAACGQDGATPVVFATLDEAAQPLRDAFNRDVGQVRLLLLMDPICPTCLRGLADIDRDLLSKLSPDAAVKTYVVHEPVIGAQSKDIAGAAALVHAPAQHFWTPTGSFGTLVGTAFGLRRGDRPLYAWDIWMAYGPEAVWTDPAPPMPRLLMHQLTGLNDDKRFARLDSGKFASEVRAMLAAPAETDPS